MKSQEKNQELTKLTIQLEPIQTKDEIVFGGFSDVLEGNLTYTNTEFDNNTGSCTNIGSCGGTNSSNCAIICFNWNCPSKKCNS